MIRKLLPLTFAIVLAVTLRLGAGGWAVVTLDTLPESVVASTPLRLSFTVRQHGQTLMDGLQPKVVAVAGKDQVASTAQPAGQTGRYVATLTFPRPADWVITVDSGFGANSRLTLLPLPVVAEASHRGNRADRRGAGPPTVRGQGLCDLPPEQSRIGEHLAWIRARPRRQKVRGRSPGEHPVETGSGAGALAAAGRRDAKPRPPARRGHRARGFHQQRRHRNRQPVGCWNPARAAPQREVTCISTRTLPPPDTSRSRGQLSDRART